MLLQIYFASPITKPITKPIAKPLNIVKRKRGQSIKALIKQTREV